MTTLSVAQAFAAYEAVRDRLPDALARSAAPTAISSLADIADQFDVFLLDAFGVLNIGESPIEGTPERVRDLQQAGKRVLVVSNAASVPRSALLSKYAQLGYAFAQDDIITSRMAAIAGLQDAGEGMWGVMGLREEQMLDFDLGGWVLLEDDPAPYASVDGIILVGSGDWSTARQHLLEDALAARPRDVRVANPDIVAPREQSFSTEPGYFAHQIADKTGIAPVFYGKPFGNIYDLAFARLGQVDRRRVAMVGDSLHTDILGAQAAGVASVLIAGYGFLAGQDAMAAIRASGITPDFIAERP